MDSVMTIKAHIRNWWWDVSSSTKVGLSIAMWVCGWLLFLILFTPFILRGIMYYLDWAFSVEIG